MIIIKDEAELLANYDITPYEFDPNKVIFISDSSIAQRIRQARGLTGTRQTQSPSSRSDRIPEQVLLLFQFCDQLHPLE
jgi:hypothetical protein